MDTSISDILASVTRAAYTTSSSLLLSGHQNSNNPNAISPAQLDLQLLTHAWVAERVAPELLPYPAELMERVVARVREQIASIEELTAHMDAGTSFGLVVLQTELERFKFLVRSFLRARIAKIDTHTPHYLAQHTSTSSSSSSSANPLLSPTELAYAQRHSALLSAHYASTFLSAFPAKLQRLDDRAGAGGVGMVEGPDLDAAVWVRCLGVSGKGRRGRGGRGERNGLESDDDEDDDGQEDGRVVLDARTGGGKTYGDVEISCGWVAGERRGEDEVMGGYSGTLAGSRRSASAPGPGGERVAKMRRGDIWLVRWSGVRDAVARGECELL